MNGDGMHRAQTVACEGSSLGRQVSEHVLEDVSQGHPHCISWKSPSLERIMVSRLLTYYICAYMYLPYPRTVCWAAWSYDLKKSQNVSVPWNPFWFG